MFSCVFISSFSEVELLAVSQQGLLLLFGDVVEWFPWGEPVLVFQSGPVGFIVLPEFTIDPHSGASGAEED